MATFVAPSVQRIQTSGEYGNAARAHGAYTAAAAAIADKIYMLRLYAGTKIYSARLINAALGAGSTLSIGYKYVDGQAGDSPTTGLLAATSTAAAAATLSSVAPVTLAYDAYIQLTVAGGAITGQIDVIVDYEFVGL